MCKHLDDLRIGVKSQSSLAIAGSCRNMPGHSLLLLDNEVERRIGHAGKFFIGVLSNSEFVVCIAREAVVGGKLLSRNSNKSDCS